MFNHRILFTACNKLVTKLHCYPQSTYKCNIIMTQQLQTIPSSFAAIRTMACSLHSNSATYEDVKNAKGHENVLLIDVREPNELQETGIIPDSINIPLGELETVLKNCSEDEFERRFCRKKPDLDSNIIFSCRSGRRSEKAMQIATKLGYSKIKNYEGGWLDWEEKHCQK